MSLNNLNAPYNYLGLLNITNSNVDAINANDIQSNTIENSLTITTKNLLVTSTSITNGISNTGSISSGTLTSTGLTTANTLQVNSTSITNGITNTGSISSGTLTSTGLTTANTLQVNSTSITNGITNTGSISSGTLTSTGLTTANTLQVNSTSTTNGISNTGSISSGTLTSTGLTTANTLQVNSTSTTNGITNTGNINSTSLISNSLSSQSGTNTISLYPQFTSYQNYNFKKLSSISNSGYLESIYTENHPTYSGYAELSVSDGTGNYNINKQFYSNSYNFYSYPSGKCVSSESYNGVSTLRLTINDASGCIIPNLFTTNITTSNIYSNTYAPFPGTSGVSINPTSSCKLYIFGYTSGMSNYIQTNSATYFGALTNYNSDASFNTTTGYYSYIHNFYTYPSGNIQNYNADNNATKILSLLNNNILLNPSTSNKQKIVSVNDNALFNYYYTNATVNSAGVSNAGQLIISAGGGSDNFNASSVNYAYTHDFQVYPSGYCLLNDCNTGSKSRLNISNGTITITDLSGNGFYNFNPSLTLNHTSTDGASTILFNSKNNVGSDFGCIMYQDNITGIGGELSRLMIAVQNDPISIYQDHILLSGAGGVLINNDITTTNLPAYSLEVQGTMGVSSPNSYTYTTIPTYIISQIGYIYQRTFSAFSATNLTQNTYNQIATSITSSDINTGTYIIDIRFNVSASSTQFVPFYFAITSTGTPNYQTNSGAIFNFQSYINCPPNASIPYYTSACCSNTAVVDWNSYSNLYFWFSVAIPITQTFYLNGSSNAANSPNSKITFTRVA